MSAILLLVSREEAEARITERIDKGRQELLHAPIQTVEDFERVGSDVSRWIKYNIDMLKTLFDSDEPVKEFSRQIHFSLGGMPEPLPVQVKALHRDIEIYLQRLASIVERLELFKVAPNVTDVGATVQVEEGRAVFIVHGHGGREHEVAIVIERLGLDAIILQEEIHHGSSTLIEKLQREAGRCGYAVVIITPDDVGRSTADGDAALKPRARQNVILELGYFVALLGRDNVTILHDPSVEIPSDFGGVGYYPLDGEGAWRIRVEAELRRAGLSS